VSNGQPDQFLTVGFGTPIDIGYLQQEMPDEPDGIDLTVAFQARMGAAFLPYDVTQKSTGTTP
jgi:hypothetical protein